MNKNSKKTIKIIKHNNKGITLVSLVVIVIVLLIILGISLYTGTDTIKEVKLEELKTNMLLIEAKAREYVEEANFRIGQEKDQSTIQKIKEEVYGNSDIGAKLQKATEADLGNISDKISISECYVVTTETLNLWGLNKIEMNKDEKYLVEFNEDELTVEVYNTKGYEGKYSLTELEELEE